MTCPQITSHALPLHSESPARVRASRRSRGRVERPDTFHRGSPGSRLAAAICPPSGEASRISSPTMIPGHLRQADRFVRSAMSGERGDPRVDLDRAVEAYNSAVRAWRAYDSGRPAGSPRSAVLQVLPWGETRRSLVAAASERGFRLVGLEESPEDQYVFRLAETETPRMGGAEVSRGVLRLTRIRNRIRQLDEIEDDGSRPLRERLRAGASALALVREASRLVGEIRARSDFGRDPRVLRLSREILHAACDEPRDLNVPGSDSAEWVARTARLYSSTAEHSIRGAYHHRGETGTDNRILMARLNLTRSRRAAAALPLAGDPAGGEALARDLSGERVALHRLMRQEQGRIVRSEVREARRLLVRAHSVLGRPRRRVSEERREAAVADYRRAQDIMAYLSELGTGDRRVSRLHQDRRWARLETTVGSASA